MEYDEIRKVKYVTGLGAWIELIADDTYFAAYLLPMWIFLH